MEQNNLFEKHLQNAKLMFDQGKDIEFIKTQLSTKNIEPQELEEIINQIKKLRHKHRNINGVKLILAGVLLLGIGFISSIYLHFTGSNALDFPLYGITAVGAVVLIIGLVFIFN